MYHFSVKQTLWSGVVVATMLVSQVALASSVVWSTPIEQTLYGSRPGEYGANQCAPVMRSIQASVSYNVRVTNEDTGAVIPCGSSVPEGTELGFSFEQHVSDDIYWFATGFAHDSPYGDWEDEAALPGGNLCVEKNLFSQVEGNDYASLSINPPDKEVVFVAGESLVACDPEGGNNSMTCEAEEEGTVTAAFKFDTTYGRFYSDDGDHKTGKCRNIYRGSNGMLMTADSSRRAGTGGWSVCTNLQPYELTVPSQTLSCTINIQETTGGEPNTPAVGGRGSCLIDSPYTITMTATDPDDDDITYGIDWNNDGDVDQWVPGSNTYVASGESAEAQRTYATVGTKRIRVLAKDETGLTSSWATHAFTCAEDPEGNGEEGGGGGIGGGGDGGDPEDQEPSPEIPKNGSIYAEPLIIQQGGTTVVSWEANGVSECRVTNTNDNTLWTTEAVDGAITVSSSERVSMPLEGQTTFNLQCDTLDGGTLSDSITVFVLPGWQEH